MRGREETTVKHISNKTESIRRYMINGRIYRFVDVHIEGGLTRGYCPKLKKWAYLHRSKIAFIDGEIVSAELVN